MRTNAIQALLLLAVVESASAVSHYVDLDSKAPTPPYTNWATAATVIQDAVDAAASGDEVIVTNGLYATGGRPAGTNLLVNRVVVDKPLTLRSANGPFCTIIQGYQVPTNILGDGAVRCVYLSDGAALSGFTLTNGATRSVDGYLPQDSLGGGLYCASFTAVASNCVIAGNTAYLFGAGAEGGSLDRCTLAGNGAHASGGGAHGGVLRGCTLLGNYSWYAGGGASMCVLSNCMLIGNSAASGGGADSSTLESCTLTNNSADYGGGACSSRLYNSGLVANHALWEAGGGAADCTLEACTLAHNSAAEGGGAFNSMLRNSLLTANSAISNPYYTYSAGPGGGASQCALTNCTLTGNSAIGSGSWAGGAAGCQLYNSIVFFNAADAQPNFDLGSSLNYCCTTPLPGAGQGNISADPQMASAAHLSILSPCIGIGLAAYAGGTGIDGEPWATPPSMGCDEVHDGSIAGALTVQVTASFTNIAVGLPVALTSSIQGRATLSVWEFGDGSSELNAPYTRHAWSAPGDYHVTLWAFNETSPDGVSATILVHVLGQPIAYVAAHNPSPLAPYSTWATAATNIQDAVDAAAAGGVVLVTNGVYAGGGRADSYDATAARVLIDKPLNVRSINGPQSTVIDGSGSIRCASLGGGAVISGFTLTNGMTDTVGGGALCVAVTAVISNCVIAGNSAFVGGGLCGGAVNNCMLVGNTAAEGGGAANASLNGCTLSGNSADDLLYYVYPGPEGGAAYGGLLTNCTLAENAAVSYYGEAVGGGAYGAVLNGCTLRNNYANSYNSGFYYGYAASGGGASFSSLSNCLLSGNSTVNWWEGDYGWYTNDGNGGGVSSSSLNGCSLIGNSQAGAWGSVLTSCALTANAGVGAAGSTLNHCTVTGNSGGGVSGCSARDCIIYFNRPANYDTGSSLDHCCAPPLAPGPGNISADPQLADSAHISAGSPCRAAGSAAYTTGTDIDGDPWLSPPSIGCDEPYPGTAIGPLSVSIAAQFTNVAVGYTLAFTATVQGRATSSRWDFGDGALVANEPCEASHAWAAPGDYQVVLSGFNETYPAGISATVTVHVVEGISYVAAHGSNPVPPYASWATAATNMQDAVDAAAVGSTIIVTNGVYRPGGTSQRDSCVIVTKPVTLRSVNGPQATMIEGELPTPSNNYNLVRCVSLADGASLSGFTLTNGIAFQGGAIWCESTNEVVTNCVLVGNLAYDYGGGAYQGLLRNCTLAANSGVPNLNSFLAGGGAYGAILSGCTLTGNSAYRGGGAANSTLSACALTGNSASGYASTGGGVLSSILSNCTLTGNSARGYGSVGGGAAYSVLDNCICYFNTAPQGPNYGQGCTFNYCCTTPLPGGGTGNLDSDPLLATASRLSANSPCRAAGNAAYAEGTDLDGEVWTNPPSIGCDEYHAAGATGQLSVAILAAYTKAAVGYPLPLSAIIVGRASTSAWDFGDGTGATNEPYATHAWTVPGNYKVVLRAFNESLPAGVSTSLFLNVDSGLHYVTAGADLQAAVDAAGVGGTVVVGDGIYAQGGYMTNRVFVDKPLILRSLNGPQATIIRGEAPGATNGYNGVRCVYLASGSSLSGFTLANGTSQGGGGLWCESSDVVVSNCVLSGNSTHYFSAGGGVYGGTLNNCVLTGNSAQSGGGACLSTLNNCLLSHNVANGAYGGGAYYCTLNNCSVVGNSAGSSGSGGGVYESALNSCTLAGNSVSGPEGLGGGAHNSMLTNCILYFNSAPAWPQYANCENGCILDHCCTTPAYPGSGNITNAPLFVSLASENLRLQSNSPCINAGNNAYAPSGPDLDGNPRIVGRTVDMGAYEFQNPASVISYAWLQQYGLPTDGSADYSDPDGDGLNNWQEWQCQTDPTNSLSGLRLLSPAITPTNATVTWQSVAGVNYFIQRSTNLAAPAAFATIATNVPGQAGTTTYTDTNAVGPGLFLYRVGVGN